ncbi:GNAT family N-acetyltransferase [Enterococcus sp. LJL128]|uniref:GNAT family N-acetyltransferase n=1 Tax=Enterococcus sp. LJL51 TaxID=3416656 RepID=UPI003CF1A098
MNQKVQLTNKRPTPEQFQQLRVNAGLSPRNIDSIAKGLENSWCCITLWNHLDELVGMGRLIGDGGTAFQIVDIAVRPDYQGQGLGKQIMSALKTYIDEKIPSAAYVSLMADGQAKELYRQYGFSETLPESEGMYYKRRK